ncbi:ADP-ribosylglycohydrolase family protein, partial [Aeromicrobium sp.]
MNDFSHDRAAGVLLGQACGDALGVPYEFGPALSPDFIPQMVGGGLGPFAPGEYSDDTSMAVCIAEVAATGADLTGAEAIDSIATNFLSWAETASDIGNQTRAVFSAARRSSEPNGIRVPRASEDFADAHPRSAGN